MTRVLIWNCCWLESEGHAQHKRANGAKEVGHSRHTVLVGLLVERVYGQRTVKSRPPTREASENDNSQAINCTTIFSAAKTAEQRKMPKRMLLIVVRLLWLEAD